MMVFDSWYYCKPDQCYKAIDIIKPLDDDDGEDFYNSKWKFRRI